MIDHFARQKGVPWNSKMKDLVKALRSGILALSLIGRGYHYAPVRENFKPNH
jgi:hypothetical protein